MVVKNEDEVALSKQAMNRAIEIGSSGDYKVETATRVDTNIAAGIVRACKELVISDLVIGWKGNISPKEWLFGSLLENLLTEIRQPIFVVNFNQPLNTFSQIVVSVPPFSEYEIGFSHWLVALKNLVYQTKVKLIFKVEKNSIHNFSASLMANKLKVVYTIDELDNWDDFFEISEAFAKNTLCFFVSARKDSISYSSKIESIPKQISKKLKESSFIIVYPSQAKLTSVDLRSFLTGTGQVAVDENPTVINKAK